MVFKAMKRPDGTMFYEINYVDKTENDFVYNYLSSLSDILKIPISERFLQFHVGGQKFVLYRQPSIQDLHIFHGLMDRLFSFLGLQNNLSCHVDE